MEPIGSFSGLASGIQWRDMVDQIMALEKSRKLDPITRQENAQQKRREAWSSFAGHLGKLNTASAALRDGSAFGVYRASVSRSASSEQTLFSASASSSAAAGSYSVEVRALATNEKLSGSTRADATTALGHAGDFWINGRKVTIAATDSLTAVRDKINAANTGTTPSGVTATLLSTTSTEHRLILTSDATGARGVELVDGGTGALRSLGLLDATQSANTAPSDAGKTETQRFTSASTPVAQLLGLSNPPGTTFINVGGAKIQVDLLNDTLAELRQRIVDAGGAAALVDETVGERTLQRLSMAGTVSVNTDPGTVQADSQRVIELLGLVRNGRPSAIRAGADAEVVVDGFTVKRRSNTISDALAGVVLTLEREEPGTTTRLTLDRDLDATVASFQAVADAYNELVKFQGAQAKPEAPLFASGSLRSMMTSVRRVLQSAVVGIDSGTSAYHRATLAGVSLQQDGTLAVDAAKLKEALVANPGDVRALFATTGTADDSEVRYLGDTAASQPGTYPVVVTRAATVATHTGSGFSGSHVDDGSTTANTMTVSDGFSGASGSITLTHGDGVDTIVTRLNDLFQAQGMSLTASKSGTDLVITGSEHGSAASFTVAYARDGAAAADPIGFAAGSYAGLDVRGYFGNDPAAEVTGSGQVLTGKAGTAAEGLAVRYSGSTARSAGSLKYVLGIGGMLQQTLDALSRSGDGTVSLQTSAIDSSLTTLAARRKDAQGQLDLRRTVLLRQFTAMEAALGRLQAQSSWLSSQIQSLRPAQQ